MRQVATDVRGSQEFDFFFGIVFGRKPNERLFVKRSLVDFLLMMPGGNYHTMIKSQAAI